MSVQYIFSIAGVCGKCVAWDRMVCAASLSVYPTPSGCWSVAVQPKMDSKEHKKGLPVGLAIFCEVGPSISWVWISHVSYPHYTIPVEEFHNPTKFHQLSI